MYILGEITTMETKYIKYVDKFVENGNKGKIHYGTTGKERKIEVEIIKVLHFVLVK